MYIRVTPRQGMWGYGPLWLTFADKTPQFIELDLVEQDLRVAISNAILAGQVMETDEDGNLIKKQENKASPIQPIKESPLACNRNMLEFKAIEMLKLGVNKIRKQLDDIKSIEFFEMLLRFEKENGKRKTVINMVEKYIYKLTAPLDINRLTNVYDALIKESDVEELKCPVADKVLIQNQEKLVEFDLTSAPPIMDELYGSCHCIIDESIPIAPEVIAKINKVEQLQQEFDHFETLKNRKARWSEDQINNSLRNKN